MELYDKLIKEIFDAAGECRGFDHAPSKACEMTDAGTLILLKEAAFEFGAQPLPAINAVLFTDDENISDRVLLKGTDIAGTTSDAPYARITVISLNADKMPDDDGLYKKLKDIEFAKYHVHPAGCLLRQSPESGREQLRVSKNAVKSGLSLENIGCGFISEYKKEPLVKAVSVLFITEKNFDYKKLASLSSKARGITDSMNKILEGLEISCDTCELKTICDEVEGLRKLHFGKDK